MKLTFFWHGTPGYRKSPQCQSDRLNQYGVSLLAHVLDDDGGLGIDHAIPWIEEGKRLANEALTGAPGPLYWSREYFGVEMNGSCTIALDLCDESCVEKLPTKAFLKALQEWQEFLAIGPVDDPKVVELDENFS